MNPILFILLILCVSGLIAAFSIWLFHFDVMTALRENWTLKQLWESRKRDEWEL